MKHLLNDMTEAEKNAIREQHEGGMKVMTEKFSRLVNSKLGDSKPFLMEQEEKISKDSVEEQSALGYVGNTVEVWKELANFIFQGFPLTVIFNIIKSASSGDVKTLNQIIDKERERLGSHYSTLKNALTKGDVAKTQQLLAKTLSDLLEPYISKLKSGFGNKD